MGYALPTAHLHLPSAKTPLLADSAPVFHLYNTQAPLALSLKMLADKAIAVVLLVILAPLMLLIAVAIHLSSPGPVLYRSKRLGKNNTPFGMWKFRTMVHNADQLRAKLRHQTGQTQQLFKLKHDPRITPLGRLLRKSSLDELPQLFNVLLGDMSLVGPRALDQDDYASFTRTFARQRVSVLPGITGIWQVSGRSNLSTERLVTLESRYIAQWSLWQDMQILLKTVPAVLTARGAM